MWPASLLGCGVSGELQRLRSLRVSAALFLHSLPGAYLKDLVKIHIRMLVISCMVCAERSPQDPEFPRLKPVGVYPVINGWAYISQKDVAGKGQDFSWPLYIMPGGDFAQQPQASVVLGCTASLSCLTRVTIV